MRRFSLRLIALVTVAALLAMIPASMDAAGLAVELKLVPSSEAAGVYEVTAQIQDAETREVLSVPTVVFPKGEEPARVTSSTQTGGILEFTIAVSPDESTVSYAVERREGNAVVASQKATIRLASRGQ